MFILFCELYSDTAIAYFVIYIVPASGTVSSFHYVLHPYKMSHPCLSPSLLADTTRCSRLMWCLLSPSPRINHLPRSPLSMYLRVAFRNQVLRTMSAPTYWSVFASRPSQYTELVNTYIQSFVQTHVYLCMCVYVPIISNIYIYDSILIPLFTNII